MKTPSQPVLIAIITLLLGIIIGYAFSKTERYDHLMGMWRSDTAPSTSEKIDAPANIPPKVSRDTHAQHMMHQPASERQFLEEMIPHHQEAVATAKQVLARGATTPEIRVLAQNIITAQEREIADMESWYNAWYGTPYVSNGTYSPMMRDLTGLSGKDLDRVFLEDMIEHHMSAIMMAHGTVSVAEHTEIKTLLENIAQTQSEEIVTMRMILKTL